MRNTHGHETAGQPSRNPTGFGYHLIREMADAGYRSNAAFARAADVSGSTLNRLIYGDVALPDPDTLAKLADALTATTPKAGRAERVAAKHNELLHAAGYRIGGAPAVRQLHPRALEIDAMLDDTSPLPDRDKASLDLLLDRLLEPYRETIARARRKRTG